MENVRIELLVENNYQTFYEKTQKMVIGPMLLPKYWNDNLWGIIIFKNDEVVGGWVGLKRIKNKYVKYLYQEVVFNSYPQIFDVQYDDEYTQIVINAAIEIAGKNNIANLFISHWSRCEKKYCIPNYNVKRNASFLVDLTNNDDIFPNLEYSQRKKIKKAIRNGLLFNVHNSNYSEDVLSVFDQLRSKTQQRALSKNKKSSMLLKSLAYYKFILENYDSVLTEVMFENRTACMQLGIKSGSVFYPYYSGSDIDLNRSTGASSFMNYKSIEYARELGCKFYDMGGCPINPDKDHPAYSLYVYKKSFGGEYHEYFYGDIVISKLKYKLINSLKSTRSILRFFSKKI